MKKYITILFMALALSSCESWLGEKGPMVNEVKDAFTTGNMAIQTLNAAYVPLMWEYQSTYYSGFFFGDIMSDDALKGGQNISDMADAYDLENFKTISDNTMVLDYYRAQYQGIARANLALEQIPQMDLDNVLTVRMKARLIAEAKFLRAYYYFRLVRLYGGVPLVTGPVYSSDNWKVPRAAAEQVYRERIIKDLEDAEKDLPLKSEYAPEDMGRVTKGAAQAMLLKVHLYIKDYPQAVAYGKKFMDEQAGEYGLCQDYADNFTLEGENGIESVFEVQYMKEGTSDYGEGNGFARGTFATMLQRSRSGAFTNAGWGFNKPTQNLYNEFEAGDARRDVCILEPKASEISNKEEEIYLGNRYVSLKRTLMGSDRKYEKLDHDARSPINMIEIRLADVYLMYAEACLENSDAATAKIYLEKVRARARGGNDVLPEFPGYSVPDYRNAYAQRRLTDSNDDLRLAIRHERRVELAMESHRWYDLCRWGIAKQVMDAYKASETEEARSHMADFVEGKHELLPIPNEEVRLGSLEQNSGY